ncbi:hypothetical protein FRC04_011759 [Tulasnella sp. 424]|nr:hypothetical protein FRC04_011759 [Tulasnella sp. 424]KAG8978103.1 hypothetical protein FRC05_011219 [Tulasnella sp. 425]
MATPSQTINDGQVETLIDGQATLTEEEQIATLVPSHPSQRSSVTVWVLSNDNPSNTKILDTTDHNKAIYLVKPDFNGKYTITNMYRMQDGGTEGEIFGYIEWHDILPDQISFKGAKKVRKGSYFSNGGSFAHNFKDEQGRKYTWKGIGSGLSPSLHCDDNFNRKVPIAQFTRSRLDHSVDPPAVVPAQIYLTPRALEIKDLLLFTFLVLEKGRRSKETSEGNRMSAWRAESQAAPNEDAGRAADTGVGPGVKRRE